MNMMIYLAFILISILFLFLVLLWHKHTKLEKMFSTAVVHLVDGEKNILENQSTLANAINDLYDFIEAEREEHMMDKEDFN